MSNQTADTSYQLSGDYSNSSRISERCCFCNGIGHIAAECPSRYRSKSSPHNPSRRYHSRGNTKYPGRGKVPYSRRESSFHVITCYICGKKGHLAKNCRSYRSISSASNPLSSEIRNSQRFCLNRHKEGHLVKDCPEDIICRRCGETGHIASDCFNAVRCNRCYKEGHFAKDCPNAIVCNICNQSGHKSDCCPTRQYSVCNKHSNGTQKDMSSLWFRSSPERPKSPELNRHTSFPCCCWAKPACAAEAGG